MKQFVYRRPWQSGIAAFMFLTVIVGAWAFFGPGAQRRVHAQEVTTRSQTVVWYGPTGFTRGHRLQGNYSNFGNAPVMVEWAVSDAVTGLVHVSTFGKPMRIAPMTGGKWTYEMGADDLDPRCEAVVWYRITYVKTQQATHVDLGTVEIIDNVTNETKTLVPQTYAVTQ
jgi:hypothetical protein